MLRWNVVFKTVAIIVGGGFFVAVLLCGSNVDPQLPDPVHAGNALRVAPGMTETEVRSILGVPAFPQPDMREIFANADQRRAIQEDRAAEKNRRGIPLERREIWKARHGSFISVTFNDDGIVQESHYSEPLDNEPWLQRAYHFLGL